jgi:hypothetical protein
MDLWPARDSQEVSDIMNLYRDDARSMAHELAKTRYERKGAANVITQLRYKLKRIGLITREGV